jgi:hypothetical protein
LFEAAKIGNQKQTSSCVGWAAAQAMYTFMKVHHQVDIFPSVLGLYGLGRIRGGESIQHGKLVDAGSFPIAVVEASMDWGVLSSEDLEFDDEKINEPVPWDLVQKASVQLSSWQRFGWDLSTREAEIKSYLAAETPVMFGMQVTDEYERLRSDQVYDGDSGFYKGGHMQCIVAYEEGVAVVAGSWGTSFANKGFARITFRELCSSHQYSDFYAINSAPQLGKS